MAAQSALFDRLTLYAPHLANPTYIPALVYGTAWKKDTTSDLVYEALKSGFTGLDTACQPKHYREHLVGEGLRRAIKDKLVRREDVFVQTKFTSIHGQDPNDIPYDPRQPVTEQVKRSVECSLHNFAVNSGSGGSSGEQSYLDSVVLHSPMQTLDETMEVWRTLESYVPDRIRNIGISNVGLSMLANVYERATIKPSVVQNRFYPATRHDTGIRRFCREKAIIYQGFWTLTANPQLLESAPVKILSQAIGISRESSLYCLVLALGNTVVLNGTTKKDTMLSDIQALTLVKAFATSNPAEWGRQVGAFKALIRE